LCKLIADQHEGKKLRIPVAGEQVWFWFRELDSQRTGNGYGANAIGFTAIKSWADLRNIRLKPWQLDALIAMDLKRRATLVTKDETPEDKPAVSERPLTARLFEALFPAKRK
jgi:hypothetical protein